MVLTEGTPPTRANLAAADSRGANFHGAHRREVTNRRVGVILGRP